MRSFAGQVADKLSFALGARSRRVAEENLQASELRFRMLVEQAPDAVLVYDFDENRLVDANKSAELLFGQ
jgi:two-component system sensor histidine kinase/response regulator